MPPRRRFTSKLLKRATDALARVTKRIAQLVPADGISEVVDIDRLDVHKGFSWSDEGERKSKAKRHDWTIDPEKGPVDDGFGLNWASEDEWGKKVRREDGVSDGPIDWKKVEAEASGREALVPGSYDPEKSEGEGKLNDGLGFNWASEGEWKKLRRRLRRSG